MIDTAKQPKLPTPKANRPVLTLPALGTFPGEVKASPGTFREALDLLGDVIGCLSIFVLLFAGLFFGGLFQ